MCLLIIIIILLSIFRWRVSFIITDDGDALIFYWRYYKQVYSGYAKEKGYKIRKVIKLFNIVS